MKSDGGSRDCQISTPFHSVPYTINTPPSSMEQRADPILQSKEGRDILDIIDSLRSQGISQYVDLPQICVCGDQSSGKSSVLEAISGVAFPTKDALCTRFATELILRRSLHEQDEG